MSKNINLDTVEDEVNNIEESDDDSSTIEIKPKKERKKVEYVFTEARKESFEKARQIRELRRTERKLKTQLEGENKQKGLLKRLK